VLFVGIDWADDHHDLCLVGKTCESLSGCLERFRIANSVDGFEQMHSKLREYEPDPSQVLVAIETPHGLLVHDLIQHGYCVYAINPKAVNRYKDRHTLSTAKDDDRDALAMAHLLRTDRHRFSPLEMLPEEYRLLGELCKDLRQMIEDKTRLMNRLTSCLKDYYPQAVGLFSGVDSPISTTFLKAFPDPSVLAACSEKKFQAFFARQRYPHPKRVSELFERTRVPAPVADPVVARAAKMRMLAVLDQLVALRGHINDYERQIQTLFADLPGHDNIPNLPGVGERIAPELAAALGPKPQDTPKRFASSKDIEKLAGCAPVTRQSGKYKHVAFRRACSKRLRRTMHDWAQASLRASRWARAYYDYHKAQQHRHNTILRNLAGKLLAILYRLWCTGERYDEQSHIQKLKDNNVIWAAQL